MSLDRVDLPIVRRLLDLPAAWEERTVFTAKEGRLAFGELRRSMLKIASRLRADGGLRPGDRVALCLPKSLETVQLIYGVLAAGAAYVPLPYPGPVGRLGAMVAAIRPRVLLTTPKLARELTAEPAAGAVQPIWTVEPAAGGRGVESLFSDAVPEGAIPAVGADDLAAVFFTSGSTGDPKGVMWSQACLARTMRWVRERSAMTEGDRLISLASLQYTTALDIFAPLESGSKVHLLSEREAQFPDRVLDCVKQERVTIWSSSATTLRLLLESGHLSGEGLEALRRVEFFGEPLALPQLRQLMAALPRAQFVNIYGATEAYDMVSYVVPRPLPAAMTALPLGQASGGGSVTLCEESGAQVAAGAVGEICVRSDRVMLGYWNDPDLTAARRLEGHADSYRSGDLAYLGDEGLLRLVGRRDNVVKLRGHRFDLGEIETVLKSHPAVRDAIVVASPTALDAAEIFAAILTDRALNLEAGLKALCRSRLPRFAWPVRFIAFDRFPLLASGKVDRRAVEREMNFRP